MKLQLTVSHIWLADTHVDFRQGLYRLGEYVSSHYDKSLHDDSLYIFYNRARTKLKCIARHQRGTLMLVKHLDEGKFSIKRDAVGLVSLDNKQLSWLLAGLDWQVMSEVSDVVYDDYF